MSGTRSQRKGAGGERELARVFQDAGISATRGGEMYGVTPDVVGIPGIHPEVKRTERFQLWAALEQAQRDARKFGDGIPVVFHRSNRKPWVAVMALTDWIPMYQTATQNIQTPPVLGAEENNMKKTHWKKIVSDPHYLGEADFQEGEEKILTIRHVTEAETVVSAEGKAQKAVVHFAEPGIKPLVLNVTNSKSISKVAKSPYFEDWAGVRIQLYIEQGVKAFGDVVNAVRVRPRAPRQTAPIPPCAECGGEIVAAMGMDAALVVARTAKRYGVSLCATCAKKRKEGQCGADSQ